MREWALFIIVAKCGNWCIAIISVIYHRMDGGRCQGDAHCHAEKDSVTCEGESVSVILLHNEDYENFF